MSTRWKYSILGILFAGIVVAYLLVPARPVRPVLPEPNGYEDILKAAQQAVSHRHLKYGEATDSELRDLVDQNRSALSLARNGFEHQTRVTTDYGLSLAEYSAQHMPILGNLKKLALAFRAEGELAEREGRTNDAARVYLEGIRFGQEVCRGGLLIDRLVGIACERICFDPLQSLVPDLDANTCRRLAQDLEQMEAGREPIQATFEEERRWASAVAGFRERIFLMLRPKFLEAARTTAAAKLADLQLRERGLILELATRAYQLEHGKAPDQPGDLLPEYLQAIPKDPLTGQDMSFEP